MTMLEKLATVGRTMDASCLEVEHDSGNQIVYARKGDTRVQITRLPSRGTGAQDLIDQLERMRRAGIKVNLAGEDCRIRVSKGLQAGERSYTVTFHPERQRGFKFTAKQGQYLAFIKMYEKLNRVAPAETDFQRYFRVSPPSVHNMIVTLEVSGLIEKQPGVARSIRLLVPPDQIPDLE